MRLFIVVSIVVFCGFYLPVDFETPNEWKHASMGFLIKDQETEKVLYAKNADLALCGASTQKLFATSIALKTLGPDHIQNSWISYSGEVSEGVILGNLYVFPNQNPTLASERFGKNVNEIIDPILFALKQLKVHRISGNIIVVDPLVDQETLPRTWIWEDMGNYYGANPTGTLLNENILEIHMSSGAIGEQVKVTKLVPEQPWLKVACMVVGANDNSDNAYAFSVPGSKAITIHGTIPANRKAFTIKASLPDPQKTLAHLVYHGLNNKGIGIGGKFKVENEIKPKQLTKLCDINGVRVREIVQKINTKSINVLTECLINIAYQGSSSTQSKEDWMKNHLKSNFGINTEGMTLKDACGLSRFNAFSPNQMVDLLMSQKNNDVLKASLPISGLSGTLKNFLAGTWLSGKVQAKSGYMQKVKGYAGYAVTKSGRPVVFCLMINNYSGSNSTTTKNLEELISKTLEAN